MTSLILCAGIGSRLAPLTDDIPKPMIEIGGKPVLEYLVNKIRKTTDDPILVNVHHKAEKIMEYFGDKLIYIYEPILLGDIASSKRINALVHDDLLVMNGDTLTTIDIEQMAIDSRREESSISSFDGMTYTGTTLFNKDHKNKILLKEYGNLWIDIGTPSSLEKAKQNYAAYM